MSNSKASPVEIERRWMVGGWPKDFGFPLLKEEAMRQGYVTVKPAVRIREESLQHTSDTTGGTAFMLCLKSGTGLVRKEVEFPIDKQYFDRIEDLIGLPLIVKMRRTYVLPDGAHLEVSRVDEGLPSEFWYAEVEFDTAEAAEAWKADAVGLGAYLSNEITDQPGQSMAAYWAQTRLGQA